MYVCKNTKEKYFHFVQEITCKLFMSSYIFLLVLEDIWMVDIYR